MNVETALGHTGAARSKKTVGDIFTLRAICRIEWLQWWYANPQFVYRDAVLSINPILQAIYKYDRRSDLTECEIPPRCGIIGRKRDKSCMSRPNAQHGCNHAGATMGNNRHKLPVTYACLDQFIADTSSLLTKCSVADATISVR
jgi:hypothetical protein